MRPASIKFMAIAASLATGSALAVDMPKEATTLGCVACHSIDKKGVGPSWQEVADRYTGKGVKNFTYEGKTYPLIEGLVMKASKGGSGNWGVMPMPPNDPAGMHKAEITKLIEFEQSLAKK